MSHPPPAVGISACLLGESVRYDGGHKRDDVAVDRLGSALRWVGVCPEVEAGLGVPREPIRLERGVRGERVRGVESGEDVTARLDAWADARCAGLDTEGLCGFVLKSSSPSCGLAGVPVHDERGRPVAEGSGRFAQVLAEAWPHLPRIDEVALRDPGRREAFATAVFTLARWRAARCEVDADNALPLFHARHRFLLASREAGAPARLARWVGSRAPSRARRYRDELMDVLGRPAGLEGQLRTLLSVVDALRLRVSTPLPFSTRAPTSFPVALATLRGLARRLDPEGLGQDAWLEPHPASLGLIEDVARGGASR